MTSHAIVVDAGSTSTRLFIYEWQTRHFPLAIRTIYPTTNAQRIASVTNAGLDTIAPGGVAAHLNDVLTAANTYIGTQARIQGRVPLYFIGTGGLRTAGNAQAILQAAHAAISNGANRNRFDVGAWDGVAADRRRIRVITGKTEGLYGWVALNYGRGRGEQISGLLELGGASMQIAYRVPEAQEDQQMVCLASGVHRVFSKTWDGFGAEVARREMKTLLVNDAGGAGGAGDVADVCLPTGQAGQAVNGRNMVGNGIFAQCLRLAERLLRANLQANNALGLPSYLDIAAYSRNFYGVSSFWHTFKFFSKWDGYSRYRSYHRQDFLDAVTTYCTSNWDDIVFPPEGNGGDEHILKYCATAAWMVTLLHNDEIGFGLDMTPWTIGVAALHARHDDLVFCRASGLVQTLPVQEGYNVSSYQIEAPQPLQPLHNYPAQPKSSVAPYNNPIVYLLSCIIVMMVGYRFVEKIRQRRDQRIKQEEFRREGPKQEEYKDEKDSVRLTV